MSRHRSRPGGWLSKSVAKARIAPERWKRIVDIPRFFSPSIPARDAFATDLDMEREGVGGGLLERVLLVRRVVAKASECVSRCDARGR